MFTHSEGTLQIKFFIYTRIISPKKKKKIETTTQVQAAPEWSPGRDAEGQDPVCGALRECKNRFGQLYDIIFWHH